MLSSIEADADSIEAVNIIRVKAHNLTSPETPRKSPMKRRGLPSPSHSTKTSQSTPVVPTAPSASLSAPQKPRSKREPPSAEPRAQSSSHGPSSFLAPRSCIFPPPFSFIFNVINLGTKPKAPLGTRDREIDGSLSQRDSTPAIASAPSDSSRRSSSKPTLVKREKYYRKDREHLSPEIQSTPLRPLLFLSPSLDVNINFNASP